MYVSLIIVWLSIVLSDSSWQYKLLFDKSQKKLSIVIHRLKYE